MRPQTQNPFVPILKIALLLTLIAVTGSIAAKDSVTLITPNIPAGTVSISVAREVEAAIGRGLDYLVATQKEDGSWSHASFPALTALPVRTLSASRDPKHQAAARKGLTHLLSCVQPDGGIYKKGRNGKSGLSTYNTAICMTVLYEVGDKSIVQTVLRAREFVAGSQQLGGDVYRGGFGYDAGTGRPYADLLNTYSAAQAMYTTAGAEDLRPSNKKRTDIDWEATIKFVERMQNKKSEDNKDGGGFFYNPTDPKGGTKTTKNDTVAFRAYGSMTYAGMLSLIYAKLPRDDHRIRSAVDWASRHWSLDENPGMGSQGLYFFYNVLTRALNAYDQDLIQTEDGKLINWREELAKKLLSLQKVDSSSGQGYWKNENGRYWENDAVLVTSYALISLQGL
ncbi:MAG: terpene cyclase/mutase family protein [Kiritimatiellae bacterium]|nr:terpene cyclase/mutase family protein [Kiritimatiellia bacterium]